MRDPRGGSRGAARGSGYPPGVRGLRGRPLADTHHASLFNTSARNKFSARNRKKGTRNRAVSAYFGSGSVND